MPISLSSAEQSAGNGLSRPPGFIDNFYQFVFNARTQRTKSTMLLGQQRMGKTEIFIRGVKRLCWEQDHRDSWENTSNDSIRIKANLFASKLTTFTEISSRPVITGDHSRNCAWHPESYARHFVRSTHFFRRPCRLPLSGNRTEPF